MHIEPLIHCDYGPLAAKVNLEPDFFTGFVPERRAEIVDHSRFRRRGAGQEDL